MTNEALHALVIVSFLLVGVPSNVAVLWIHTRKNSRVAKNKFPLIFASLDLFALVAVLPAQQYNFETRTESPSDSIIVNVCMLFAINGYLLALLMATIDKFYAVMFPYKYGKRRGTIFKAAIFIMLVVNTALSIAQATVVDILGRKAILIINGIYVIIIMLMFLTICIFYIAIIAKLIRNLRKVQDNG